ncbi:MAG: adenylate/guanylate cyclase domain-containing protein [Pseudomonadota bacterium]
MIAEGRRLTNAGALALTLLTVIVVFATFRTVAFLAATEANARDLVHAYFYPAVPTRGDIVLVLIEENTLGGLAYRSPIDRGFLADLISSLAAHAPRAIGIDLLFDQPTEAAKDARLLELFQPGALPAPIIVAAADASNGLSQAQSDWLTAALEGALVGQVELAFDPFNDVVRAAPGRAAVTGQSALSLGPAMAEAAGLPVGNEGFEIAFAPTIDQGEFAPRLIAAFHPYFTPAQIAGKFVLIGVALDNADRHSTPLSVTSPTSSAPGVEAHAHALAQVIDQRRLTEAPIWLEAVLTLAAGLMTVICLMAPMNIPVRVAAFALILLIFAALPAYAINGAAMRLPVLAPLIGGAASGAIIAFVRWRSEALTRHRLRDAFGRFVSPTVVCQIEREPGALRLGGARREITCVFTDVAGFTTLCEGLAADELVDLLNRYLGGASDIFINHGGTIDKFVGDAIVGFFGAPVGRDDHAAAAIRMAVALDAFATRFAAEERANGRAFGMTRIGVHSGEATVGNFGGDLFFDYTAMGDTVNVAARLEGANKAFGGQLCISGDALTSAGGEVAGVLTRPIGHLRVKGRDAPMEAHEAFADTDPRVKAQTGYIAAYTILQSGDGDAGAAFAALAETWPDDGLIRFHLTRCREGESGTVITLKEK